MKALVWKGVNKLSIETVPDPKIVSHKDIIVKVTLSSVCGSDLHLLAGYISTMKVGDIIGHEFVGEIVEVGGEVKNLHIGDRVVVMPFIVCGHCVYCQREQWSLCDNTNPNDEIPEKMFGDTTAGVYGYSHAFGGYSGSHAQLIRVPFAELSAFKIPDGISDEKAIFVSDAFATGYMGAEFCEIRKGDIVAVWGCGGVGQMAIQSAYLMGAEKVVAIDRFPERLKMAREKGKAETLNYEEVNVLEALKEITAGRGPDKCIDAVGMEAHGVGFTFLYDRVKQATHLEMDRPLVLREVILACRKGGIVSIIGDYTGLDDKIPMGAAMNKALTLKMGQQVGQKYAVRLLNMISEGKIDPSYLITHRMSLEDGPLGYEIFQKKHENVMRVVFEPNRPLPAAPAAA